MDCMLKSVIPHLHRPNVEIEFRFGRKKQHGFDTNIGPDMYQKVMRRLDRYQGWESKIGRSDTIYYTLDGKRARYNNVTDEMDEFIKKQKIFTEDYNLSPLDIRLSISSEEPYEYSDLIEFVKEKERVRTSFIRKNVRIDVSMIKSDPEDKDSESQFEYQLELEIINPTIIQNDHDIYTILYKLFDILKISCDLV